MFKFLRSRKFILTKKKIVFILLLIVVIFFAGKYFFIDSRKTALDFAIVKKGDIREELTLSGKIDARDHATLVFGISGKVDWVGVKEGDWVKKGQAVATLEKETLEATLRQKWQDFTAAKAESDKYYNDHKAGSAESYDQKIERTALDATQNKAYDSVRIAQENLKSAVLNSPIDGLIVSAEPSLSGINITSLNSAYEIVNPSTIYLKATADQTEIGGIKKGQAGEIIFDSYPNQEVEGEVDEISFTPAKDETGTVYDVKIVFKNIDNNDYKYRLGMTADINFVIKEKKNVLVIPIKYINSDEKRKFVFVGKDKKKQYVETGIESNQDIEIKEGLSEGEVVYD